MTVRLRWATGAGLLLVAFIAATIWWVSNQSREYAPSWLFSHTAEGGSLEPQPDGTFTLTLTNVDPHVIAFTDRPNRDAIVMDASRLVASWDSVFGESPPNVVLVEHTPEGTTNSVALTISNPVLSPPLDQGESSQAEQTLVFDAELILDEERSVSAPSSGDGEVSASQTFGSASLFIDTFMAFPETFTCTYPDGRAPLTQTLLVSSADDQFYGPGEFLAKCQEDGGTVTES